MKIKEKEFLINQIKLSGEVYVRFLRLRGKYSLALQEQLKTNNLVRLLQTTK